MAEKKARGPRGEGSKIYKHPTRELWVKELPLGKDPETGKRRRRKIYGSSRNDVVRKLADLRAQSGGTIMPKAKGTVAELVDGWLENDIRAGRAANTYANYEMLWRVYANPLIGTRKLGDFGPQDVEALYATLRKQGVGARTIASIGTRLRTAFQKAVRQRQIPSNPFSLVTKPTHQAKVSSFLDVEQAGRFLTACRGDRFEAMYVLMLEGGLRLGEALGLRWKSIDWKSKTILVEDQLVEVDGRVEIAPTKTSSSRRQIEIGPLAVQALRRRERASKREGYSSAFVFTTEAGTHPRRSNLRQRSFQPILDAAKIDHLTLHGLRHSMGAIMAAAGVQPKVLQERYGHTTIKMTLDRYGHLLPGMGRSAANAMDNVLRRAAAKSRKATQRAKPVRGNGSK